MMRLAQKAALAAGALGLIAGGVTLTGTAFADQQPAPAAPVAADGLRSAVEDFSYPAADQILKDRNIVLKRGDGNITLAECDSQPGLLQIWARGKDDRVCFRTTGPKGYLALELPSVYAAKGGSVTTELNTTVEKTEKSFDVPENTWTSVGESTDPTGRPYMLLEIIAG